VSPGRPALLGAVLAAALAVGEVRATAPAAPPAEVAPASVVERGATLERRVTAPMGWEPGVPIELEVTISVPDGASASFDPVGRTLGPFDVREATVTPASPGVPARLRVRLVAWEDGELEVPAVSATVTLADGAKVPLASPAAAVTLGSLVGEDVPLTELAAGDIRDAIDIDDGRWMWWLAAGIATAGALGFVWWLMRRPHAVPPAPPLPPHAWAIRELERLAADDLPARGEVDAFFVRLSSIVRTYIEGRFGIAAPDRTTQEFIREASRHPDLSGDHGRALAEFLRTADMVKFAAARPAADACGGALDRMRAFVDATAPRAEESAP
jgi:hypothetical protein